MNNKTVYLTAEGLSKLQAELNHLITVERPRVARRIHDAKLDGDISENAEYEDAKQEQSFLEGRIATLEGAAEERRGHRAAPTATRWASAPRW